LDKISSLEKKKYKELEEQNKQLKKQNGIENCEKEIAELKSNYLS